MEAQHVEALIKRAEKKPAALAAVPAPVPVSVSSIVDRVEADLEAMIQENKTAEVNK